MENFNEQIFFDNAEEEYWNGPVPDNFPEKDKKRAVKRKTDVKKSIRKKKIDKEVFGQTTARPLHTYSKSKVHCSCPICRAKTKKKKNVYGTFERNGKNWKHSDKQRIDAAEDKIKEPV